jgi:hypothetical protein
MDNWISEIFLVNWSDGIGSIRSFFCKNVSSIDKGDNLMMNRIEDYTMILPASRTRLLMLEPHS